MQKPRFRWYRSQVFACENSADSVSTNGAEFPLCLALSSHTNSHREILTGIFRPFCTTLFYNFHFAVHYYPLTDSHTNMHPFVVRKVHGGTFRLFCATQFLETAPHFLIALFFVEVFAHEFASENSRSNFSTVL